jgi:hypothetical protein
MKKMIAAAAGILAMAVFAQAPVTKTHQVSASASTAASVQTKATAKAGAKVAPKAYGHHAHKASTKTPAATAPAK